MYEEPQEAIDIKDPRKKVAIFYTVHADDEAIGMAGDIIRMKQNDRKVIVVLLTNDLPRQDWRAPRDDKERMNKEFDFWRKMNGDIACDSPICTYEGKGMTHDFHLRRKERLMWSRRVEFMEAVQELNVDQILMANDAEGLDEMVSFQGEHNKDSYASFVEKIAEVIRSFDSRFPGAAHRMIEGEQCFKHVSHIACGDAGMKLKREKQQKGEEFDIRFFRVYIYSQPKEKRKSQHIQSLDKEEHQKKRHALKEYKKLIPEAKRFAIGYHTVPKIIDNAMQDENEYGDDQPEVSWLSA